MRPASLNRRVQRAWTARSRSTRTALTATLAIVVALANEPALFAQCQTHLAIASDAASGDQFGYSVAMNGKLCVIGARLDDAGAVNCGSAYVFRFSPLTGIWSQEAKLTAPDAAANDEFGFSVAVHSSALTGDIIVVGARHDDDKGADSGSAYFFKKMGTAWTQISKVTATDGASGDRFGFATAIAGDYALITARDDDAPSTNTGSAYAFHFNGTSWTQYAKLVAADAASNDQFGHSVAMTLKSDGTGAYAIIGAWRDDAPTTNTGSAYLFSFNTQSAAWSQVVKLTASDAAANDEFGYSVAISDTPEGYLALVGARNDDDNGTDTGSAYVFQLDGTSWQQQAKLTASDGLPNDQFGESVAIAGQGTGMLVGANNNDQNGSNAGAAYVFWQEAKDLTWTEAGKLLPSVAGAGDLFGGSVAASLDRGVVGCLSNDSAGNEAGAAIFYTGLSGVDTNGNGLADACELMGDINGDGLVDVNDLLILIFTWGACPAWPAPCVADLDGNGVVEVIDLVIVLDQWS